MSTTTEPSASRRSVDVGEPVDMRRRLVALEAAESDRVVQQVVVGVDDIDTSAGGG